MIPIAIRNISVVLKIVGVPGIFVSKCNDSTGRCCERTAEALTRNWMRLSARLAAGAGVHGLVQRWRGWRQPLVTISLRYANCAMTVKHVQ